MKSKVIGLDVSVKSEGRRKEELISINIEKQKGVIPIKIGKRNLWTEHNMLIIMVMWLQILLILLVLGVI